MKLKNIALLGAAGLNLSSGAISTQNNPNTKQAIIETFSQSKNEETCLPLKQAEQIDSIPPIEHLNLEIKSLEGTPFGGKKKMIKPYYGELLGYGQTAYIMNTYNNRAIDGNGIFNAEDTIEVPLIYPELQKFFPSKIDHIWENSAFKPFEEKNENIIILSQCANGKNALGYYHKGTLKLATYVSIGKAGSKTIQGKFPLKHDAIYRRSKKYRNASMPYAIHIHGGYFMHQGWSDGSPRSHGCIRVPGVYQKRLYENLPKQGAVVILTGLYEPTLQ